MDSLLIQIENKNLEGLKDLVNQGSDVKTTGTFSLNGQKIFLDVTPLFAATIADLLPFIDYLVGRYPHFPPDPLILPANSDIEHVIEVRELVGAVCLFDDNKEVQKYGRKCLLKAMKLRRDFARPKVVPAPSKWAKFVFSTQEILDSSRASKLLLFQGKRKRTMQAFFNIKRISTKHDSFPTRLFIYNMYKFALENWKTRGLTRSSCFAASFYIFEMIESSRLMDQLIVNQTESKNALHLTIIEFNNLLENQRLNRLDLFQHESVLTFEHLFAALVFTCEYQLQVQDLSSVDKNENEPIISNIILNILDLLVAIPKTETESELLKTQLATYVGLYELTRAEGTPTLLLRLCAKHQGQTFEFEVIQLLLGAGTNVHAVDQHGFSSLELLSEKELENSYMWDVDSYSDRAHYFTCIVRSILDGRSVDDYGELFGEIGALRYIKCNRLHYPSTELHLLLHDMFDPKY